MGADCLWVYRAQKWTFFWCFFSDLGKKDLSSATTVPAITTTSAGILPLLVVEAGTGVAEGPGSTCAISQDSRGDHGGRAGEFVWVSSV